MAKELTEEALNGALQGTELTKSLLAFCAASPGPSAPEYRRCARCGCAAAQTLGRQGHHVDNGVCADRWPICVDRAQFDGCMINLGKTDVTTRRGGTL